MLNGMKWHYELEISAHIVVEARFHYFAGNDVALISLLNGRHRP